jgi:hypothetical protein
VDWFSRFYCEARALFPPTTWTVDDINEER